MTAPAPPHWMTLFVDTDQNAGTGWCGFDVVVNRLPPQNDTACVERNQGGWNWTPVAQVACRSAGNELHLAVPRAVLGLPTDETIFDFKWADGIPDPGDIMDFYRTGDVAPNGRFCYRFDAK